MAISWQTGGPTCGVVLVMQYEYGGKTYTRVARCRDGKNGVLKWQELPSCHIIGQPATRWSTLDDDRSAMAMGALEKMVREQGAAVSFSVDFAVNEWTIYDENGNDLVEAPSLIEAIEKLTEADQQTKGVVT